MMGLMPFPRRLVKIHRAVHRAVIGDGERGELQFVRLVHQFVQPAGPIEQLNTRCADADGQSQRATSGKITAPQKFRASRHAEKLLTMRPVHGVRPEKFGVEHPRLRPILLHTQ
jgi:hypothetical protein